MSGKSDTGGRFQIDPETVERGRNKAFNILVLLVVGFVIFLLGSFSAVGKLSGSKDVCDPANPWTAVENQRVTLEDGSTAYLRCGWAGDIRACPLPQDILTWSDKNRAKWYEVRQHCDLIVKYAEEYDLDPIDFASLIMQESGGWAGAESSAGAMGLTQTMPFHECSSWNVEENLSCGANIFAGHFERDGLREGLAAYNAGQNGRDTYGRGYDFADIVLSIRDQVRAASQVVIK